MKLVSFQNKSFYFNHDIRPDDSAYLNLLHYHQLYEIYFITQGTCSYFIDNRTYHLKPGDLALIPEGIIHNTVYQNTGHSRMLINCVSDYIPASARPTSFLYRNPKITEQIQDIFNAIEQEYTYPDHFSEEAIICQIKLLFFLLARHSNTYTSAEKGNEMITRAAAYLQQHFQEDISLPGIARFAAVSPEHFSRLFKKETGLGYREYVNQLRLQKAEQLLKQSSGASIAEIAAECGFADSNYFSVKFKKMYGVSPKTMLIRNQQ